MKSARVAGIVPVMWLVVSIGGHRERHLLVVSGLAGELNFQVGFDLRGGRGGVGQAGADGDHGEFCSAGHLNHVKVAVGVAGVKGFDGDGDEKFALALVADAFAARGVADPSL